MERGFFVMLIKCSGKLLNTAFLMLFKHKRAAGHCLDYFTFQHKISDDADHVIDSPVAWADSGW